MLFISVDDVPKPQFLGKVSCVVILYPSELERKSGFSKKASLRMVVKVLLTDSPSKLTCFKISENKIVSSNQMLPSES